MLLRSKTTPPAPPIQQTGFDSLLNNTTGKNNTADGAQALNNNTTGINNAGFGVNALFSNTTGNLNIALVSILCREHYWQQQHSPGC